MPIIDDTESEPTEAFTLQLSNAVGAPIGQGTGVGTIFDDDSPVIQIFNAIVNEGSSGQSNMTFTAYMLKAQTFDVSASYTTASDTAIAGQDFVQTSGTFTIPAGQTQALINVPIIGDTAVEPDEILDLVLSNPVNGTFNDTPPTQTTVFGTITNDDVSGVDAAMTNIDFTASGQYPPDTLPFTLTLHNNGDSATSAFGITFFLTSATDNTNFPLTVVDSATNQPVSLTLAAGETRTLNLIASFNNTTAPHNGYFITAVAQISDVNSSNNTLTSSVSFVVG